PAWHWRELRHECGRADARDLRGVHHDKRRREKNPRRRWPGGGSHGGSDRGHEHVCRRPGVECLPARAEARGDAGLVAAKEVAAGASCVRVHESDGSTVMNVTKSKSKGMLG